jgi:hypothetical protein
MYKARILPKPILNYNKICKHQSMEWFNGSGQFADKVVTATNINAQLCSCCNK